MDIENIKIQNSEDVWLTCKICDQDLRPDIDGLTLDIVVEMAKDHRCTK